MLTKNIRGVYPTMITPYGKDKKIDFEAVERLTVWFWEQGCEGIFAACQSSEISYLTKEERAMLVRTVVSTANRLSKEDTSRSPMVIVASGHVSNCFEDQLEELKLICAEKPDALILITNRMDIENTTDEKWIADAEKLIAELPSDMPLGLYECPAPYKRLLTPAMLEWCKSTGRFRFIKDTCCNAKKINNRLEILKGSNIGLFNANSQTLLSSLKNGAEGYCGVMGNIHPKLYKKLMSYDVNSIEAEKLASYLSLSANVERMAYPCCAKYYLDKYENINMTIFAKSCPEENFNDYNKMCIDQFAVLDKVIEEIL